jgi:hypothetical protein
MKMSETLKNKQNSTKSTENNHNEPKLLRIQIARRLIQLASESTAHGVHNIFKTDNPCICFMWTALSLTSATFCVYMIINSIITFSIYPVTTKTRLEYQSEFIFPTVSICNTKPFMSRAAYDFTLSQFATTYPSFMNYSFIRNVVYGNYTDPNDIYTFLNLKVNATSPALTAITLFQNQIADVSFNDTFRKTFGLTTEQFLFQTEFENEAISASDYFVRYYDPVYGNCYKFNTGVAPNGSAIPFFKQYQSGPGNGLHTVHFVDVFPNQSYNFMNLLKSTTFGIKLSINNNDTIPIYNNNMIPAKPGTCTYIGLSKIVAKSQPHPFSECQDLTNYHSLLYDKIIRLNKAYSQKLCFQLCMQKRVIDMCDCAVIRFPNVDNYKSCTNISQINCIQSSVQIINQTGCEDYCPLECETTYYDYEMAVDFFPDHTYYDVYKADRVTQQVLAYANVNASNVTYSDLANSMACLYVYFKDMRLMRIEEEQAMTVVTSCSFFLIL